MTTAIEKIVRPFQSGDVFTQSRLAPSPFNPTVELPPDITTVWEGSADSEFIDEGLSWFSGIATDMKEDKTQRKSKTVKVTNPDDPDDESKLFVERIDKAKFKSGDGKELNLSFDWSSPKDKAV